MKIKYQEFTAGQLPRLPPGILEQKQNCGYSPYTPQCFAGFKEEGWLMAPLLRGAFIVFGL